MFGLPETAVGSIIAALIAALVTLLGLIISKEQKTSEFRQAWIDSLREEMATLISHAINVQTVSLQELTREQIWRETRENLRAMGQAASMIQLRLNPEEAESTEILAHMEKLRGLFQQVEMNEDELETVRDALIDSTQQVVKKEWLRVRNGEQVYRVARYIAMAVTILCFLALFIKAFRPPGR